MANDSICFGRRHQADLSKSGWAFACSAAGEEDSPRSRCVLCVQLPAVTAAFFSSRIALMHLLTPARTSPQTPHAQIARRANLPHA